MRVHLGLVLFVVAGGVSAQCEKDQSCVSECGQSCSAHCGITAESASAVATARRFLPRTGFTRTPLSPQVSRDVRGERGLRRKWPLHHPGAVQFAD
jgi:hypothetical protein